MDSLEILDGTANFQHMNNALEIVTPEKIKSFLELYFYHWQRHCPIIHQQTFDASKAALPLLITMFAIGGMYSKYANEIASIQLLLDLFEIIVYKTPGLEVEYEFRRGTQACEDYIKEQQQLEELQAAYLMIVVQYWGGNAIAKERVRQQRFMRLISVCPNLLSSILAEFLRSVTGRTIKAVVDNAS